MSRYEWVVKNDDESNRQFIFRMMTFLKSHPFDIIFASTIEDNFVLYARGFKKLISAKKILTLHMVNAYADFQSALSLRRWVRNHGKRMLLKTVDALNVISEPQSKYLAERIQTQLPIHLIPGGHFEETNFHPVQYNKTEPIRIIVPGSVDARRRDYGSVLELLQLAKEERVSISITLLGGFSTAYGAGVMQQCQEWLKTNNNLFTFEEAHLDQPLFDDTIRNAHFIWMPLQNKTMISDGVTEMYGISICSGNVGDIIRHAKPFFAPSFLQMDKALERAALRYDSVIDILSFIQSLHPADYATLQEKSRSAAAY
ncbi:MAG: hypothetical protein EOO88_51175, partial [Pedobacter sp.]